MEVLLWFTASSGVVDELGRSSEIGQQNNERYLTLYRREGEEWHQTQVYMSDVYDIGRGDGIKYVYWHLIMHV